MKKKMKKLREKRDKATGKTMANFVPRKKKKITHYN